MTGLYIAGMGFPVTDGPPAKLVIYPNIFSSVLCIMQNFTLLESPNFKHFSGVTRRWVFYGCFSREAALKLTSWSGQPKITLINSYFFVVNVKSFNLLVFMSFDGNFQKHFILWTLLF